MNIPYYRKIGIRFEATLIFLGCFLPMGSHVAAYSEEKAGFTVKIREEVFPYNILGIYTLPLERLAIEVVGKTSGDEFTLIAERGRMIRSDLHQWTWQAPETPGLYPIVIRQKGSADTIRLNVFVMVPYARLKGEYLNGYRIGSYPKVPLRDLEIYKPVPGFIEVTRENEETQVSPHFTLKEFVSKQGGEYPRYMVLRERLLLKLEFLLQIVNLKGHQCESFSIMSGYRTPYYNQLIGNVEYSRHMWGGASDIFIDENPKDGVMDDLNGDGRIDGKDTALFYDLIETLYETKTYEPFQGGLGNYGSTSSHGPFVHVDVRGFRARWGR